MKKVSLSIWKWTRFFQRRELPNKVIKTRFFQSVMLLNTNPCGWGVSRVSSTCKKNLVNINLLTFWLFSWQQSEKHGPKKGSNRNTGPFFNIRNWGMISGRNIAKIYTFWSPITIKLSYYSSDENRKKVLLKIAKIDFFKGSKILQKDSRKPIIVVWTHLYIPKLIEEVSDTISQKVHFPVFIVF